MTNSLFPKAESNYPRLPCFVGNFAVLIKRPASERGLYEN
jgi:hypothetical protein